MAGFQSKVNVRSAKNKANKFDLSGQTIATSDFFKPFPSRSIPVYPDDKFSIKDETFVRLQPMSVPTFGRVDMINRWFFVPYSSVYPQWLHFIEERPYSGNVIYDVYKAKNSTILRALCYDQSSVDNIGSNEFVTLDPNGSSLSGHDFGFWSNQEAVNKWYNFTPRGRHLYQILLGLGYSINFSLAEQSYMSLLPFLCYTRVIADYYTDPQISNDFEKWFHGSGPGDNAQNLYLIFRMIATTNYDFDYFTSAWENPSSPSSIHGNVINGIEDITLVDSNHQTGVWAPNFDTPHIFAHDSNNNTAIFNLTQYALDSLRGLTNYMRRHGLVGWRLVDRFLGDYGKKLDFKEANQSLFLHSKSVPIQISDVTATAGTASNVLGAFAGKGVGYADSDFTFESGSLHGQLICVTSIIPKIGYYQGRCKQTGVLSIQPLDFYHGDMDNIGVQAIQLQELFASALSTSELGTNWSNSYDPKNIFGYQNRYAEFKNGYDSLLGDFRINTLRTGFESFHLMRQIFPDGGTYDITQEPWKSLRSISGIFRKGEQEQYDRIFSYQSADTDHFMLFMNFDISAVRNMQSISDDLLETSHEQVQDVELHRDGSLFN